MATLNLVTEGVKGGKPTRKKQGRSIIYIDGESEIDGIDTNSICVDAFDGCGASYKERDQCKIIIRKGAKSITFNSFDDLFNLIQPPLI